jgi:hypothetical protein
MIVEGSVLLCVQVQDRLEDRLSSAQPVGTGNIDLASDVIKKCEITRSKDAQELANILKTPHFKVILYVVQYCLLKDFCMMVIIALMSYG